MNDTSLPGLLVLLGFCLTAIVGWIANCVQIYQMVGGDITALFIFKCVGVFIGPLGSVLGLIGLF